MHFLSLQSGREQSLVIFCLTYNGREIPVLVVGEAKWSVLWCCLDNEASAGPIQQQQLNYRATEHSAGAGVSGAPGNWMHTHSLPLHNILKSYRHCDINVPDKRNAKDCLNCDELCSMRHAFTLMSKNIWPIRWSPAAQDDTLKIFRSLSDVSVNESLNKETNNMRIERKQNCEAAPSNLPQPLPDWILLWNF